MSSAHTKHHLEGLHPNIKCFRHPDHLGGESHSLLVSSRKLVCVDNERACIGGLDICFGRWDTQSHPFSDCHPTEFERTVFPGQDYNNARIEDFQKVDDFMSNQQSKLEVGRVSMVGDESGRREVRLFLKVGSTFADVLISYSFLSPL